MSRMNLREMLKERYGEALVIEAAQANSKETDRVLKTLESDWEAGLSFAPMTAFTLSLDRPQRDGQDEATELQHLCHEAAGLLTSIIANAWAGSLTREEAVAICSAMSRFVWGGQITAADDRVKINASQLAAMWDKSHADQDPINF